MTDRPLVPHVLDRLAQREITPRAAVRELVALGEYEGQAREAVGGVFGAGDLVEILANGRERYAHSRRLVNDVEAEIRERNRARGAARRIDVFHYFLEDGILRKERMGSFWWSRAGGVTSDNADLIEQLAKDGVSAPPDGGIVFPADGKRFFDALLIHFSGSFVRAESAEKSARGLAGCL